MSAFMPSPRFAQLESFDNHLNVDPNNTERFTSMDSMNFQPPASTFTQLGNGSSTNLSEISSGQNSLLSNHSVNNLPTALTSDTSPPVQQHPQFQPQQQQIFQQQQQQQQQQPQQSRAVVNQLVSTEAANSDMTGSNTKYVYFERKPNLLSKTTQDKAASIKLTLENYYTLSVSHAIERNQRRLS